VLVVDDSPLFAEAITGILEAEPGFHVVGVATQGREAVEMTRRLRPHVITMDVHMPVMGGLEAIDAIMADTPTPILVVTSDPRASTGHELHFEALRRGALDVSPKPRSLHSQAEQRAFRDQLRLLSRVAVVRHLAGHRHLWRADRVDRWRQRSGAEAEARRAPGLDQAGEPQGRVVAIVASTGGPAALAKVLEALPADFPAPVLVTQHIAAGFAESFASWLDGVALLGVSLAKQGEPLRDGAVLVAPDNAHMTVTTQGRIELDRGPPVDGHRPSGTKLLASVAQVYAARGVGLVMTGMGADGAKGLEELRRAGGVTLAQDEASCVVFGMPKVALETGAASRAVALADVPRVLCELVIEGPGKAGGGAKAGGT
jgi:two-component system chemotaxis response regulator CheB